MAGPPKHFEFTDHGCQRAIERGITQSQMTDCILSSDARKLLRKGMHGGNVYRYTKLVSGNTLEVVAEVWKDSCWIVTGYWKNN
jgi:hypothetical protein